MITPEYCRVMARYNAWQNQNIRRIVEGMDADALGRDRGAYFGSIHATLNHLLWGDTIWMSRFDGGQGLDVAMKDSVDMTPTITVWWAERFKMDGRISLWAEDLSSLDLVGELTWFSGLLGREVHRPVGLCVTHFFNHQTHHRGQVHAMLTAAGATTDDTDLFLMPGEV